MWNSNIIFLFEIFPFVTCKRDVAEDLLSNIRQKKCHEIYFQELFCYATSKWNLILHMEVYFVLHFRWIRRELQLLFSEHMRKCFQFNMVSSLRTKHVCRQTSLSISHKFTRDFYIKGNLRKMVNFIKYSCRRIFP